MTGSLSIALACDADLCGLYPKIRKIRETMTIERANEIYETNKPLMDERLLGGTLRRKWGCNPKRIITYRGECYERRS